MKRKETRLRALALRGQLSLRFLRVMLPTIALLLLLQLITYRSAAPSDRGALAPQLLLRELYAALEQCCKEREDFKGAYEYATKQRALQEA